MRLQAGGRQWLATDLNLCPAAGGTRDGAGAESEFYWVWSYPDPPALWLFSPEVHLLK